MWDFLSFRDLYKSQSGVKNGYYFLICIRDSSMIQMYHLLTPQASEKKISHFDPELTFVEVSLMFDNIDNIQ